MNTRACWEARGRQTFLGFGMALWMGLSLGVEAVASTNHWAFKPSRKPDVPTRFRASHAGSNPIDAFIFSTLQGQGMAPAGPAEPAVLLRRITFDLTGLPPTPEELGNFLKRPTEKAYADVVERLLASPHYGERWGRHWMDVARYADTAGDNADYPVPEIRLYRDYIINAFNQDMPYDQFVEEQLAGDILAKRGPPDRHAERVVATGFLALSRRYGTGPFELWHLTLENTLETVSQAFLGLNLKCARCHDHKFDPATMRDYYGLYGIFASTEFPWAGSEEVQSKNFPRQKFVSLVPEAMAAPSLSAWQARLAALRSKIAQAEKLKPGDKPGEERWKKDLEALKQEFRILERPGSPADLPVAYAVQDGKAMDAFLQLRGEPGNHGPMVPRCAPNFLAGGGPLAIPDGTSGRREFARWVTRPDNPLTARVMVNRIWQHHFGRGIVATPNNLGVRGDAPSHPELLDYLASRFVEGGWSVKAVHRLIVSSKTYRMSSGKAPANHSRDPSNRYYSSFERRRLEAEEIRDAMLFASGGLDLTRPGGHPFPPPEKWTWTQHKPFKDCYESSHRSVYLMTQRLQRHPFMGLFDGPDTNSSTEARRVSTVPQQALFALNNAFVENQARLLARRVLASTASEREKLRELCSRAWGRFPTQPEELLFRDWIGRAAASLKDSAGATGGAVEEAWTGLARVVLISNEFMYVD